MKSEFVYTVEEVAEILAVSPQLVYKMLREGEMPGKKLGRVWRVPICDFREWLGRV